MCTDQGDTAACPEAARLPAVIPGASLVGGHDWTLTDCVHPISFWLQAHLGVCAIATSQEVLNEGHTLGHMAYSRLMLSARGSRRPGTEHRFLAGLAFPPNGGRPAGARVSTSGIAVARVRVRGLTGAERPVKSSCPSLGASTIHRGYSPGPLRIRQRPLHQFPPRLDLPSLVSEHRTPRVDVTGSVQITHTPGTASRSSVERHCRTGWACVPSMECARRAT